MKFALTRIGLCGMSVVLLAGCAKEELPPLPQGIQELSGILERTELSLVRRGTHLLLQGGTPRYYVESSTISLQDYEGRAITVRGMLTHNTPPTELPLLVVDDLTENREETFRRYKIPALGLSLEVPREWKGRIEGAEAHFTASGALQPTLTLTLGAGGELPRNSVPVMLDGKRAVRSLDIQSGAQEVSIDLSPGQVLTIHFFPAQLPEARELFLAILHSITFSKEEHPQSDIRSSKHSEASLDSAHGKPCGGPAGILCAVGQYCEITDLEANIGKCKPLRRGT